MPARVVVVTGSPKSSTLLTVVGFPARKNHNNITATAAAPGSRTESILYFWRTFMEGKEIVQGE